MPARSWPTINSDAIADGRSRKPSLDYFTGIRWGNSERLFAFVLPRKGNPFYVCPAFEEDRVHERMSNAPLGRESKILTWQEDNDPYRAGRRRLFAMPE